MTLTINLSSEIEAELVSRARASGLEVASYVEQVLRDKISVQQNEELSPTERANLWRQATHDLPRTPPLSDEEIGRESIYGDRGL